MSDTTNSLTYYTRGTIGDQLSCYSVECERLNCVIIHPFSNFPLFNVFVGISSSTRSLEVRSTSSLKMPPKISKPGGKDLKAVRPAEVRKIQEEKKAVARPLAVVTADNAPSNTASAAASMCNHQKYGVKADLWEWTVQLCEGGEIKVVGQDQPGRPGITVKRITTTVIRARIKNDFVASQNGSIYRLIGKMWRPDISNKFSQKLTKAFQNGFPEDWMKIGKEEWLQRQEIMRARHQGTQVHVGFLCQMQPQFLFY